MTGVGFGVRGERQTEVLHALVSREPLQLLRHRGRVLRDEAQRVELRVQQIVVELARFGLAESTFCASSEALQGEQNVAEVFVQRDAIGNHLLRLARQLQRLLVQDPAACKPRSG